MEKKNTKQISKQRASINLPLWHNPQGALHCDGELQVELQVMFAFKSVAQGLSSTKDIEKTYETATTQKMAMKTFIVKSAWKKKNYLYFKTNFCFSFGTI